jgi:NAD(P)-dependent dehydrogenase (short-subunit alcohol dehydrogenase family)
MQTILTKHFGFNQQIAVVTGALGKLGPIWCEALLQAGALVAAVDLPNTTPPEAFVALQQAYPQALAVFEANVTDKPSLELAYQHIVQRWPKAPLHVLVNNAGIDQPPTSDSLGGQPAPTLFTITADSIDRVLHVNTIGALLAMQVFGQPMVTQGCGSIINIGSLYASVSPDPWLYATLPNPFLKPPAYGASKAALFALTQQFATHWGPSGVRVNMLSPGGVANNQQAGFVERFCQRVPLQRLALNDDLVAPLLFLAGAGSAYVTGVNLPVNGGFTAW